MTIGADNPNRRKAWQRIVLPLAVSVISFGVGFLVLRGINKPSTTPEGYTIFDVPLGDSPRRGARQPKVTIVEFGSFVCGSCAKLAPTLAKLIELYPEDVQVVFKHQPSRRTPLAGKAALAVEAARQQDKFWHVHDLIYAHQDTLDDRALREIGRRAGLDDHRLATMLANETAPAIAEDLALTRRLKAWGTPFLFINGVPYRGELPLAALRSIVDSEIARADKLLERGVPRAALYARLIEGGKTASENALVPSQGPRDMVYDPALRYRLDVTGAPSLGSADALVTVVEFSHLMCSFRWEVRPTLRRLMEEYPGKIRLVWRDYLIGAPAEARIAARAARAAGRQGRFWEMVDTLLDNQRALGMGHVGGYAARLGLASDRFWQDMRDPAIEQAIQADHDLGMRLGLTGAPVFFINGRHILGGVEYEKFKRIVDEELQRATSLVSTGVPPGQVYAEVMRLAVDPLQ